jgi:predicted nucleotidyltransferase component of viral defense system
MFKEELRKIVLEEQEKGTPNFLIKNIIKEYLQFPVLNFIYNDKKYKNIIFTGGSCLRICFGLPRMSEDLDFDLKKSDWKKFNIQELATDIQKYFKTNFLFDVEIKTQSKSRIYLKFPILKELGVANDSESDLLYVKVEPMESPFIAPQTEIQSVFKYGYNFIIKRYNLEFLMTGKLQAIFLREWFSGKENEIDIKGRDFYDLYWYLEEGVKPNYKNLKKSIKINNEKELYRELKNRIEKKVTSKKLSYDLKNFFKEQNFVDNFCKNYKEIIFTKLEEK